MTKYDEYRSRSPVDVAKLTPELAAAIEELRAKFKSPATPASSSSAPTSSEPLVPKYQRPHSGPSTVKPRSSSSKLPRRARRRAARAAFIDSLEARGAHGCRPRDFKARTQAGVRAVFENKSGREARLALRRFPRAMRSKLVHIARHPCSGRELAADLHEQWSRWVIAVALLVWSERRSSRRKGCRGVVDGFTQGMICGLFRNRDGESYSRSRVFGTSYRRDSDECSPFVALERAGLLFWSAPRTYEANPRFVGPPDENGRRWPFAVYWLPRDVGPA